MMSSDDGLSHLKENPEFTHFFFEVRNKPQSNVTSSNGIASNVTSSMDLHQM